MAMGGGNYLKDGWVRLSTRLSEDDLKSIELLNPFENFGQRIADLESLAEIIPTHLQSTLLAFGYNPRPLRALGFNKSKDANWSLPWHQDRVAIMPRRKTDPNLTNWSKKDGIWHCEPSHKILRQMAFVYIAFNDMTDISGGIEIADASHAYGIVAAKDISELIAKSSIAKPRLQRGECLLIAALTLHRSGRNKNQNQRRAFRFDIQSSPKPCWN